MKFLLVVLAVHLVAELVSAKRKESKGNNTEKRSQTVFHPARVSAAIKKLCAEGGNKQSP